MEWLDVCATPPPDEVEVVSVRDSVWDWDVVSDCDWVSDEDLVWLEKELDEEDPPEKPPTHWVFDHWLDAPTELTSL